VYPTFDNMSVAVPAPGAIALLGLAGLVGRRRR
jgi:MYXO-CTERM domain-containing protein